MNSDYGKDYKCFYIPKAKGYRKIVTYRSHDSELFSLHKDASVSLERHLRQSIFAKAYIKHRSIVTNAQAHMYNDIFICLDIQDFFQSINQSRLISTLYYEINKTSHKQFTKEQCQILVKSCSLSSKGVAVGLKPSPALANIYLKEFDVKLYTWLRQQNLQNVIYTRYADDLTISFKCTNNDIQENTMLITQYIGRSLKTYGLKLNSCKTRIIDLRISNHVRITGINLIRDENNLRKLSVGRKRKDKLFYDALDTYKKVLGPEHIAQLKGIQSFILSIEGTSYEETYSNKMKQEIVQLGFNSLKELIDSL